MTPYFLWAFQQLVLLEGWETNDPNDLGGPTVLGISSKWWPEWHEKVMEAPNVQAKVGIAKCFYWHKYWKRLNLDAIGNRYVAYERFETTVHGETLGRKMEKNVCNWFGVSTLKASYEKYGAFAVVVCWNLFQYDAYVDSTQTRYFKGWQRRCWDNIRAYLKEMANKAGASQ